MRAWLDAQGVEYHAFYLANMVEVKGDAALAEALRRRTDVARLELNPRVAQQYAAVAPRWRTLAPAAAQATAALPYGLQFTNADDVWAQGFSRCGHRGGIARYRRDVGSRGHQASLPRLG
ncbi:MAG: hypothetical protein IPK16_17015 [Anaerolineales bacterium]|nr:hypothetical protein [Anaerolineales bacterium]